MLRPRVSLALALFCLCALAGPIVAFAQTSAKAATTTITVTAGKPKELSFTLSKKQVPAGTVVFKVTNKGKLVHGFKVCTKTSATDTANACAGVATKPLKPGASATLTVKLTANGKYEFLSTTAGQAASGMKGLLGVTVKAGASPTPTPVPTPTTTTTPVATGATCTNPQATTVTVQEGDNGFTISQTTFHCGTITLSLQNTGTFQHNFDIIGVANGAGVTPTLNPGASATVTVTLPPNKFTVQSDVGDQAAQGLQGAITVTNG